MRHYGIMLWHYLAVPFEIAENTHLQGLGLRLLAVPEYSIHFNDFRRSMHLVSASGMILLRISFSHKDYEIAKLT